MPPRLTDWSLAIAVWLAFATGVISLVSGRAELWLLFATHGAIGLWLLLLTIKKLQRVWLRLLRLGLWDQSTGLGAIATGFVLFTLGSGIWWVFGGKLVVLGYNLLNWHIVAGLLLTLFVALHMFARAKPLRSRDVRGRRQALSSTGYALAGIALWPLQQVLGWAANTGERRFTGSREANSFAGNAFPSTSWVADAPKPIDTATWQLTIGGAVTQPLTLSYADLDRADTLRATLDCTGGFFSTQDWQGCAVGRLLDEAGVISEAQYVSFISVTGYRWSLPIAEARLALLATRVGKEPLSHAHGAPLRLVAPGQRGFIWIKWLTRIDVRSGSDPGELLSIYTSSFGG